MKLKFSEPLGPLGPIIRVRIGVPTRFVRVMRSIGVDRRGSVEVNALIDTGASVSAFKPEVFSKIRLTAFDYGDVRTPDTDEPVEVSRFLVDVVFGRECEIRNLQVFEMGFKGQPIDGVLGRDVLAHAMFTHAGIHKTWEMVVHPPPYED